MSTLTTVSGGARHAIGVATRAIFVMAALALTMLGFVLGTPTAHATDQTSLDAQVKQSLVYIGVTFTGYVHFPAGLMDDQDHWIGPLQPGGTCSGVIVDPSGYIATAGHCVGGDPLSEKQEFYQAAFLKVAPQMQNDPDTLNKWVNRATNEEWPIEGRQPGSQPTLNVLVIQPQMVGRIITQPVTADVVEFQKFGDGDNALLKVSGLPPLPALPVADRVPPPGTAITSVGFPGAVGDSGIDPNRLQEPSFKDGTVSSTQIQPSGAATTEVSAASSPGMSGGPTVNNATGEVVGLNDYGVSNEQGTAEVAGTNFITDAAGLHAFLVKNSVHLVSLPAPAKPFPWLWVAAGGTVVAVLLLALPAVLMVRHRAKRRSAPRIDGSQLIQPAPSAQPAPQQSVGSPEPRPAYQQSPTGTGALGHERSDVLATASPPLTLSTNGAVEIK
jgi:serine protease Do